MPAPRIALSIKQQPNQVLSINRQCIIPDIVLRFAEPMSFGAWRAHLSLDMLTQMLQNETCQHSSVQGHHLSFVPARLKIQKKASLSRDFHVSEIMQTAANIDALVVVPSNAFTSWNIQAMPMPMLMPTEILISEKVDLYLAYEFVRVCKVLSNVFLGIVIYAHNLVSKLLAVEAGDNGRGIHNMCDAFSLKGFQISCSTNGPCTYIESTCIALGRADSNGYKLRAGNLACRKKARIHACILAASEDLLRVPGRE